MKRSLARASGWWCLFVGALSLLSTASARADEPAECRSANPVDWPQPARPYFMIAFDTSLSMNASDVGATNSCGYANTRNGHARCALRNMINAFAGEVNFGLAAFPGAGGGLGGLAGVHVSDDQRRHAAGLGLLDQSALHGRLCCLPLRQLDAGLARGGRRTPRARNILVELPTDEHWNPGFSNSNLNLLLPWVDNACGDCRELWTAGGTPLNGLLRDVERYLKSGWSSPLGGASLTTPLETGEFERYGENGIDACRSVNVILLTDGEESCDSASPPGTNDPTAAQAQLAAQSMLNGWNLGGSPDTIHWKAYTHVIAFGQAVTGANLIATAGGTGTAKTAGNEAQLSAALASIIQGSIDAEICDNQDNNCNGCSGRGFSRLVQPRQDRARARLRCRPSRPGVLLHRSELGKLASTPTRTASIRTRTRRETSGTCRAGDPSSSASEPEDGGCARTRASPATRKTTTASSR